MIVAANREKIETIRETALNLHQDSIELKKQLHGCQNSSRIDRFYVPVLKVMVSSVVT